MTATRTEERGTRKPLSWWDRSKFLILLAVTWGVLLWAELVSNPIIPLPDAVNQTLQDKWWVLALALVEALRQLHYLISENWAAYHQFFTEKIFGGAERRSSRMHDWTRYRLGRALRVATLVALTAVILGAVNDTSPVVALFELPATIWSALPFILQAVFIMALAVMQFVAIFWFMSRGGVEVYFPDDIKTRFDDVWGQDPVVSRVKENMLFLEDPESIEKRGGYVPGGILLWGPPGTGKTLMAEAVAGETGKPYVFVEPGAFINMFFGVGILKVKGLFRKLRKLAVRYGGVIVFFDEADALGNRGQLAQGGWSPGSGASSWDALTACNGLGYSSPTTASTLFRASLPRSTDGGGRGSFVARFVVGGGGGGGMGTLQALLTELSGLKKPRGFMNRVVRRMLGMRPKPPPKYRILVMMATNMPQALDEALLRPGRIDRIYKVGYPSKEGRRRTYEGYLAKVSHQLSPADIDKLAVITPYATGATIKDMVNEALVVAIRDGRESITWADVLKAKQLKEHGLPDEFEYVERERHSVAVHEACHAVVAHRLQKHMLIDMATIERRGDVGGFVSSIPPEDQFVGWKSEREADVMVFLASLAGERLFFGGDNSEGVGGDLRGATFIVMRMLGYAGMGSRIGSRAITLAGISGHQMAIEDGSDRQLLDTEFGRQVEEKLAELYERTRRLLEDNRLEVLAVAHALETYKTLSGDDVAAIIEGTQGPLVDGRPYRQAQFAAVAEAYHAEAEEAHRAHGALQAPLPVLNGHHPEFESEDVVVVAAEPASSPWARPSQSEPGED